MRGSDADDRSGESMMTVSRDGKISTFDLRLDSGGGACSEAADGHG